MGRSWIVGCAVLVACGDPPGLTMEVSVPAGTARVELFLGTTDCVRDNDQACIGVAPPAFTSQKLGDGFYLDSDTVEQVDVTGGKTAIRIQSDLATDRFVKLLVVVGFDANGAATGTFVKTGVTIPVNDVVVWKVALAPWQQLLDRYSTPPADGDHVLVWNRKDRNLSSCVLVEHVAGGHSSFAFLVPKADTDCDDALTECDPFWATKPPAANGPRSQANCIAAPIDSGTGVPGVCLLAGPICDETSVTQSGCAPTLTRYCIPDDYCRACGGAGSYTTSCLLTIAKMGSVLQTVTFHAQNLGICPSTNEDRLNLDLSAVLYNAGVSTAAPTTCSAVGIRNLDAATPAISFGSSALLTFNAAIVADAQFDVQLVNSAPCTVELRWTNGMAGLMSGYALLDVTTGPTHVIVPLEVGFETGACAAPLAFAPRLATTGPFTTCAN